LDILPEINLNPNTITSEGEITMEYTKKIEANRRNAQLSTGPKNTDGTRWNAARHGVLSGGGVIEVIDGADARELHEELRTRLWEGLSPVGFVEEDLVTR
jgi:hypothetical protein